MKRVRFNINLFLVSYADVLFMLKTFLAFEKGPILSLVLWIGEWLIY